MLVIRGYVLNARLENMEVRGELKGHGVFEIYLLKLSQRIVGKELHFDVQQREKGEYVL